MTRIFLDDITIRVPAWVVDLETFRRWSDADDFPESGQISFLNGEVWIDLSKEQLFSHNQVRGEVGSVLHGMVKAERAGHFFARGAYLSNVEAGASHCPDGTFVSFEALSEGRVRIVGGKTEGRDELEGSPDMVLEVVSPSSVEKDTTVLRAAYAAAGVREYWLVDARDETLKFDILRLNRGNYSAVRKRAGWVRSEVFGRWFRLTRRPGEDGYPEFTLEVRTDGP